MANNLVRRAAEVSYDMNISSDVDLKKLVVLSVSDASLGTMPRCGSQGGFVLFVTDERVLTQMAPTAAMLWSRRRLKRVARSSLATEGMALCKAVEAAEHLRAALAELMWVSFDYRQWEQAADFAKVVACTDAKSVYDHVTREAGTASDKRLAVDLVALKEFFHDQVMEDCSDVRWLPGPKECGRWPHQISCSTRSVDCCHVGRTLHGG